MNEKEERELLRKYAHEANEATVQALRGRAEALATIVRNISCDAVNCPNEAVKALYCEIAADYGKKLYELNIIIEDIERSIEA